jgi:hypothetical protein
MNTLENRGFASLHSCLFRFRSAFPLQTEILHFLSATFSTEKGPQFRIFRHFPRAEKIVSPKQSIYPLASQNKVSGHITNVSTNVSNRTQRHIIIVSVPRNPLRFNPAKTRKHVKSKTSKITCPDTLIRSRPAMCLQSVWSAPDPGGAASEYHTLSFPKTSLASFPVPRRFSVIPWHLVFVFWSFPLPPFTIHRSSPKFLEGL